MMSTMFFCYAYGLFLEQFFVAQYNPLVRFDPACLFVCLFVWVS